MFKALTDRINRDTDYPERQHKIDMLTRVLDGKMYDHLAYPFHQERKDETGSGEYIPLRDRRPSVRTGMCRVVVDDSISLLFSDSHFPEIQCDEQAVTDTLERFIKDVKLNDFMFECGTKGSVGSVCVLFRLLNSRVFLTAMNTEYLTPTFSPMAPDTLSLVREQYKITGEQARDMGYEIAKDDSTLIFWFRREWDAQEERWFKPWKVRSDKPEELIPAVDTGKTVIHGLGFVPMVWVKNLPGGDSIDGVATFHDDAINTMMEADYLLSQGGRGLKYASDPTLLIKEPSGSSDDSMVHGGGNAIIVDKDGDAKLLEINGTASAAVTEYVRGLREFALERMHGNRTSPEKLSTAQSGRAMELMNQALIWLADRLRITYGEGALLSILRMVIRVSRKYPVLIRGSKVDNIAPDTLEVTLRWPDWYPRTADDRNVTAQALKFHKEAGHISRETAVKAIAADFDIENIPAELIAIEAEVQADAKLEASLKPKPAAPQ